MAIWTQSLEESEWTRRVFLSSSIKGLLSLTLIGRLFELQVLKSEHYRLLSDKNRIQTWPETPVRGRFLDAKGTILADHKVVYSCFLAPEGDLEQLLFVEKPLALSEEQMNALKKRVSTKKRFHPLLIKMNLSWQELVYLEMNATSLPSMIITPSFWRYYPYGLSLCHVLGYVGWPSKAERKNMMETLPSAISKTISHTHVGKIGLEKTNQFNLMGEYGLQYVEVDAYGRKVQTLREVESKPGANVSLTIDAKIQAATWQTMQDAEVIGGCTVVVENKTGAIKSLVSLPSFDPHLFLKGIPHNAWNELRNSGALMNKAIGGLYAPGSTFKMMIGLAALQAGIIQPHTYYNCPGHLEVGGHTFYCHSWRYGGHGDMRLQQALACSCDVFFYNVALKMKPSDLENVARDFGFGQPTGIELSGEKTGIIPTPAWRKSRKQAWTLGDMINLTIGQGALLATPLQLVRMMAIFANGLDVVPLHLHLDQEPRTPLVLTNYDPAHIELIYKGMEDVIQKPWGTGRRACMPGLVGKTGSTQVCRITKEQRKDPNFFLNRPRHLKDHAFFVGSTKDHSIAVVVEHGGSGGRVAAPLAKNILLAIGKT